MTPKLILSDPTYEVANKSFEGENGSLIIPYPCSFSYDCSPYLIDFKAGTYIIDLYGASGGHAQVSSIQSESGGKGGHVSALITFPQRQKLYLYIGGKGQNKWDSPKKGGFNGGGNSNDNRGTGGGATDLRTAKDDFYQRTLVAGGGGGAFSNPDTGRHAPGGNGGGLEGEPGGVADQGFFPCFGTQSECKVNQTRGNLFDDGDFGKGSAADFGGGGGGWYGGGSANACGSSGGSSYYGNLPFGYSETGVHNGNGYAVINTIFLFQSETSFCHSFRFYFFHFTLAEFFCIEKE